ncbi:hypothetical protein NPIL_129171 [Nephila pilipes]|uniref:Uncharacterized protein n=1 Tax=Nephila pilipes TaxID=299642 RepID=A0A8X6JYC7_NEPPI|nr:hypothetical protein NPIL_504101 [Nephila pilipes]GFS85778.1 hypothetical protein NPIL_129171 [Nephila pilipes]
MKSHFFRNALACIDGFMISDEIYDRALDLLQFIIGDKNMLIDAHMIALLKSTPVKKENDFMSLRNFCDNAQTPVHESLGSCRNIVKVVLKGQEH